MDVFFSGSFQEGVDSGGVGTVRIFPVIWDVNGGVVADGVQFQCLQCVPALFGREQVLYRGVIRSFARDKVANRLSHVTLIIRHHKK